LANQQTLIFPTQRELETHQQSSKIKLQTKNSAKNEDAYEQTVVVHFKQHNQQVQPLRSKS
jgi:hypothetical protein